VFTKILLKIYVVLFNLQLCKKDLFGTVAEEKEVNQITGKLQEARKTKSYDTFQILAQTVTEKCLFDLIMPLREVRIKMFIIDTV
jgi:U3 small nucleolar RNA-associated protein 20